MPDIRVGTLTGLRQRNKKGLANLARPLEFMVPGEGPKSNAEIDLTVEWEGNNKDFIPEEKILANSKACEELFNTLAEWNSYLENHIPYFSERETVPEELQP